MVGESSRRLPPWMSAADSDNKKERKKKKSDPPLPTSTRKRRKRNEIQDKELPNKKSRPPSAAAAELTVEDLVNIAREYVKGKEEVDQNRNQNQNWSLHGELESQKPSSTNDLPRQGSPDGEPKDLTGASCSAMTGDPAQDMLNLLLGPLLKKPVE